MACLAARMCCCDGFTWCCANKDTTVAKSGLVAWLSHNREPTIDLICVDRDACSLLFLGGVGRESIGSPD